MIQVFRFIKSVNMENRTLAQVLMALAVVLCFGCDDGGGANGSTENTAARCGDQLDNDNDGAVDCDDVECAVVCALQDTSIDSDSESASDTPTGPTFHVFLLLGQSNMEGWPKAQDADRTEDERVRVLGFDNCSITGRQQDEWDVAAPPLHSCWNDGLGPGDYFAKTLVEVIPDGNTIGLVPCAKNGEAIETFMKDGGVHWDWIIARARLAQEAGGVIEGMIFHQGESNSGQSTWPAKVNTFVEDLKAELGLGDIPFIAGELAYDGGCASHNVYVNQLPDVVTNSYVVSAEGLELDEADTEWHLHFSHDAQVELGRRYGVQMIEALGW